MQEKTAYKAPMTTGQLQKKPNAKKPSFATRLIEIFVLLVIVCFLIGMFLPSVGGPRRAGVRTLCLNNIRQLSLAMRNYESVNGHLPPAYIADEDGKPMHSWRALQPVFIRRTLEWPQQFKTARCDRPGLPMLIGRAWRARDQHQLQVGDREGHCVRWRS